MRASRLEVAGITACVGLVVLLLVVVLRAAPDPAGQARQSAGGATAAERFWPQWRGPYANGVSKHADPPVEWSETKNIRWKVEIPGRGSASPVVWDDRIFLLSAIPISLTGAAAHSPQGGVQPRLEAEARYELRL